MKYLVILACFQISLQSTVFDDHYTAAVVEYNSHWDKSVKVKENIIYNARSYASIIEKAAEYKPDIIVFPEIGLTNYDHTEFIKVPEPDEKNIPAQDTSQDEVLQIVSKAARDNQMYVVINLHEIYNKTNLVAKYNTNVVFDRNGTVISRYRKYNLFGEKYLNITKEPEMVTFATDFGVRFGTFICFDILFKQPAVDLIRNYQIHDIVYPTAWFHEMPFLTATQAQSSWSFGNNVNILAANHNDVKKGSSGSGLYRGMTNKPIAKISSTNESFIIIGKMPKHDFLVPPNLTDMDKIVSVDVEGPEKTFTWKDDINNYNTSLLVPNMDNSKPIYVQGVHIGYNFTTNYTQKLCQNDFCCNFDIKFTSTFHVISYNPVSDFDPLNDFNKFRYRVMVMNGKRSFMGFRTAGLQVCGIAPCINNATSGCFSFPEKSDLKKERIFIKRIEYALQSTSFDLVNITTEFENNGMLIQPNLFFSSNQPGVFGEIPDPNSITFIIRKGTKNVANLVFASERLISGAIYARNYAQDGVFPPKPNIADKTSATTVLILITLILCLYTERKL